MSQRPTYEQCLDRGMSANEAAKATRRTPSAARKWAKERGVRWAVKPRVDGREGRANA